MIVLVILIGSVVFMYLLNYVHISVLTQNQWHFLLLSTALAFFLLVMLRGILSGQVEGNTSGVSMLKGFLGDAYLMPVLFYFAWYVISAAVGNVLTGTNSDFTGFGSQPNRWVSTQNSIEL